MLGPDLDFGPGKRRMGKRNTRKQAEYKWLG
jgi:hypothetical protein